MMQPRASAFSPSWSSRAVGPRGLWFAGEGFLHPWESRRRVLSKSPKKASVVDRRPPPSQLAELATIEVRTDCKDEKRRII